MFEIGNSLREARARRSIDLTHAELGTKIRVKYLRALEDERFEMLPSQTYVKGFLRTYADYLGLDGQLYVDEYNSRFAVGDDFEARPRRSSVRPERRTRRLETSIVLLAVAVVGIVTLVVISAWQLSGSGSGSPQPPAHHSTRKPKKPVNHGPVAFLKIRAVTGSSYVAVHRGSGPTGRLLFAGTVQKGQSVPFRHGTHFWVDVSSPQNLQILVRGRVANVAGNRPAVLTVTSGGVQAT